MCIGPQYKVNRLLDTLRAERQELFVTATGRGSTKLAGTRRLTLWASINTLDWAIEQVRQHADRTGVRRKQA